MNSITYLGPLVFEVGQIKDSKKIMLEPLLSIVQFLVSDMKSKYCLNKSQILGKPEFTDINKKFGDDNALQSILLERKELDKKSIIHFINKARRLTKQFHNESQYSPILNKLQKDTENMKAQLGKDIFQYQFDLIKENINFALEIYVSNRQYDQRVQDSIQIILDLLIYNIQLYISEFTTCDYRIKDNQIFINFPDNQDFIIEPLIQEQQTPQNNQANVQLSQQQLQQQIRQTERLSFDTNNPPSPTRQRLLQRVQTQTSQRISNLQSSQYSQQNQTSENLQFQHLLNQQQNNQQQPENPIIDQNNSQDQIICRLGKVLQKKQDKIYFKAPIFWNSKPRRTIYYNFTEPQLQIDRIGSIFKDKQIFYSCDRLLLYNCAQNLNQHSFLLRIDQFINTEVICYSTDIVKNQQNYQEIQNLILNDQNLKQILNLRDNEIIYNIIVDDLRSTLIEQFNMEIDEEIIQCL
ncbi:hypothetical protein pb186bvf_007788 [Paramecium bursaria]